MSQGNDNTSNNKPSARKAREAGRQRMHSEEAEYDNAAYTDETSEKGEADMTDEARQDSDRLEQDAFETRRPSIDFPIVAIAGGAGSVDAFTTVLRQLDRASDDGYAAGGLSFIFVQHPELPEPEESAQLARASIESATRLSVHEVVGGMKLEQNSVYLLPANQMFMIVGTPVANASDETRHVATFVAESTNGAIERRMPLDYFYRTLARLQGPRSIGVLLSGLTTDGTLGAAAIKEAGGLTFAQDQSAQHDTLPKSAYIHGCVDYVLSPAGLARELERLGDNPYFNLALEAQLGRAEEHFQANQLAFGKIFSLLKQASGVDFSQYKETTIRRRIYRRMILSRFESFTKYVAHLVEHPEEVLTLHEDLLINVTSFFRDPESFDELKAKVFSQLTPGRTSPLRIWVAGCSTGEEAYSIAIALLEHLGGNVSQFPIQIFATDVSDSAIAKARKGIYLENIQQDVSKERLRKYFKKVEGGYLISKTVRDLCVFARQNIVKDPPFSRLDLISCRNVMIYLGSPMQKQLISTFHQTLQPTGFLMLGTSETIGLSSSMFQLIDKKNKIYAKKSSLIPMPKSLAPVPSVGTLPDILDATVVTGWTDRPYQPSADIRNFSDLQKEADRIVLSKHATPGVVIDEEMDIRHFRGQTGHFLEPSPGMASLNLLKMAREGLRLELRAAVNKARRSNMTVRKEGLQLQIEDRIKDIAIEVTPIKAPGLKQNFYLVLFEEMVQPEYEIEEGKPKRRSSESDRQIKLLTQELADTKEYLQRTIEEQDAYTEELKSANEEIQSSNEELQSTNEELETAKEELQSINEELTTLNDELQVRNYELTQVNNDLSNLLANVNFSVIMVGMDLRIRLFNPLAEKMLNLIPTDIGRPVVDIKPNIRIDDLETHIGEVIDTLRVVELEVEDRKGRWHSLVIRPYKTSDNKIDGAVVILSDIDTLKRSLDEAKRSEIMLAALIDQVREPLVLLSPTFHIEMANRGFHQLFMLRREEIQGKPLFGIDADQWNLPGLKSVLEKLQRGQMEVQTFEITHTFEHVGAKKLKLSARRISNEDSRILLTIEDLS